MKKGKNAGSLSKYWTRSRPVTNGYGKKASTQCTGEQTYRVALIEHVLAKLRLNTNYKNIINIFLNATAKTKRMIQAGIEPAISWFVAKRLAIWPLDP